ASRLVAQARNQFGGLAEDFARVAPAAGQAAQATTGLGTAAGQAGQQAQQAGGTWNQIGQAALQSGQQQAQAANAAGTAAQNLGRNLQAAGQGAQNAAAAGSGLAGVLGQLATAGGAAGGGFGLGGGVLGYIAGGLAARGIEESAQALGVLTRSVVENGEAWILAGQRLQTTLGLTRQQAEQERQAIADQNRGIPFQSTVQLTSQIGPSLQERGYGVGDINGITRALEELAAVSGTAPQQAQRAFYQLSQAFALGKLQGQDLRTLIEDMPPLFQALARSTGLSQEQLMQMAHAGQLTAGVLADALLGSVRQVDQQFQGMGNTVTRASADVGNAWTETSGKISEQTGLVRELAGAYETFADVLRSPEFRVVLGSVAQFATDLAKGVQDSERQIATLRSTLQGLGGIFDPNAGKAGPSEDLQAAGGRLRDLQQRRDTLTGANDPAARLGIGDIGDGFDLPILRRHAEEQAAQRQRDLAEIDRQISDARADVDRAARQLVFPVGKNAQGGPSGIVNPEGEGTAADYAGKNVAVPSGLPESTQKLLEQNKTLVDLQEHLNDLRRAEGGLVRGAANYERDKAAISKDEADTVAKIATERQKENVEAYAKSRDIPVEQARQELQGVQNVNKGLDERRTILSQIAAAKDVASFARDRGDTDTFHAAQRTIAQEQEKLAQLDQRRADTAARTRESLVGQADAYAKLAAEEEKITRAQRPTPGGDPASLRNPQDVQLVQQGAFRRFYQQVESEANRQDAGASQLDRVDAQIAAVQDAMARRTETRVVGEQELNRLTQERVRLAEREQVQIDALVQSDQARLDKQRLAVQRAQSGGGDIEDRIRQAGETAADQYKDPTPEQQKADPGAQVRIASMREEAQANGELLERERARKEALQALGDTLLQFTEREHTLQEQLRAGVISWDQYATAVQRAYVQSQQQARQQRIGDLLNRGDPANTRGALGSGQGVGFGAQVGAGAQAAGLQYVEQYGNVAKDTANFLTQMGEQGVDAFAQLATGAKLNLTEISTSLEQLAVKMFLQIALARLLQAAFGGSPAAGAPGVATGAAAQSFGGLSSGGSAVGGGGIYHGGGEVGAGGGPIIVDPGLFRGAPRYHGGGDIGPDERRAVLQTGERVLSRQEARAYAGGPSGPPPINFKVVNNAGAAVGAPQVRQNGDGSIDIMMQLERAQAGNITGGKMDKAASTRWGVDRRLV
ncbi:MAG: tape measure protein, partial [Blastococcus sp.]